MDQIYNLGAAPFTRRQIVVMGALGAMTLALGGCAPRTDAAGAAGSNAQAFTAGTYTGTGEGRAAKITVEVTFSSDKIESVAVVDHGETVFISDAALEELPARIVEYQSTGLDAITGATMTSMGVIAAVEDAAQQAGADMKALRKMPDIEESSTVEDIECDIVIAGAGAGGMGAAMAAANEGAKVVVLEKTSNMGGNCLVSGGLIEYIDAPQEVRAEMTEPLRDYFASLLAEAREGGASAEFCDALQEAYDDYYAGGKTTVFDTTGLYAMERCQCEKDGDYRGLTTDYPVHDPASHLVGVCPWLIDLGVELKTPLDICFGYTWPNFTTPVNTLGTGGSGYFDAFRTIIADKKLPVTMLTCTAATELITEGDAVVGLVGVAEDGTTYRVRASKGTILATGGFAGNPELLKKYNKLWPWDADTALPSTNTSCHTGDGLVMVEALGGKIDGLGNPMVFPTVDPKQHNIENIVCDGPYLNKEGKRFVDETANRADIVNATMEQTDRMLYIVCDAVQLAVTDGLTMGGWGPAEESLVEHGMLYRADTLEELAEAVGVDAGNLVSSVTAWNTMLETGEDPEFGRRVFDMVGPVTTPPFYCSPATYAVHDSGTCAGVIVDEHNAALRESGEPIAGLYCVGELVNDHGGVRSIGEGMQVALHLLGK